MFSTRRLGSAEPACPDGTFLAGYIMDGWEKWRVVCLGVLDVEDVEDVYLFAGMTMGLLALGLGMLLQHQKLRKIAAELTIGHRHYSRGSGEGKSKHNHS